MVKKQFLKNKCRATFEAPKDITQSAKHVYLVGDFNDWDPHATPMEHKKEHFIVTLDLELNREYQYRYLADERFWFNDEDAEKYVPNPFTGDNAVVITYQLASVS